MVGLGAGMTLVFGIIASVVYLRPDTLAEKDINPISFLPDKLKKISVLATMVKRLEAVA